jgi:tetratricopeptide (TPR) repeat protein
MARSRDTEQKLRQALALHQGGNLVLAETLYRDVLRADPRNAQALGMLGLIEAGKRNPDAAIGLLRESIQLHPANPATHFNLGLVYQEQQRSADALACFERALALSPDAPQVGNARGLALKDLGRYAEALDAYEAVLALAPDYFEALSNRGVALRYLGRYQESAATFAHALRLRPDSAEVHNQLGYVLHKMGRDEEALASFERALALRPLDKDTWNNRSLALHALGRHEEAIDACRRALEIDPSLAEGWMNMGVSLYELKRYDEAHACLVRAHELQPANQDVRVNLGNVLLELDRPDEALSNYRDVIDARPGDQDVLMNMGNALRDLHRYDEAMAYYDRALALDGSCADVHWNMALCLLTMGQFERGWSEYEWRRKIPALYDAARRFDAPAWHGSEPLNGKRILVYAEQGLGDTLHMCRYARELARLGARVILEVQRPLLGVLSSLEGVETLIGRGDAVPHHDFHVPMLSLPFAFRTRLESIPAQVPYLRADPLLAARWKEVVGTGSALNIGLAWSGNTAYKNDHRRSMRLAELLNGLPEGAQFWSLQKDVGAQDAATMEGNSRLRCFEQNDFAHTAAQIMSMDAVLCVETSIAQLAAALGKPTFVLLAFTADWRWLSGRTDSPWYPNVELFRQDIAADWAPVLQRVSARIGQLPRRSAGDC